jgi:hypothetical protein
MLNKDMFSWTGFGWGFVYEGVDFVLVSGLNKDDLINFRFVHDFGFYVLLVDKYSFGWEISSCVKFLDKFKSDLKVILTLLDKERENKDDTNMWFVAYLDPTEQIHNEIININPVDVWKLDKSKKILFFYKIK